MYKYLFSFIFIPVLFVAFATPASAKSQVYYYQSNNQEQQISYLYSVIAQLQAQLVALQSYKPVSNPYYNAGNTSTNEISRVTTGSVDSDGNDAVSMEGEVTFRRDSEARVWFEYGVNSNLSYSTESIEISGDAGDTEDFKLSATDLDDNRTYYYRAVAEDDNGRYAEGAVRSFRFEGRNNYDNDDDDDDDNNNNDDWSLEVDDDNYETGDTVRVDYTVEDEDDKNWIGLYEVGDSNKNYVAFKYVRNEEGYVTFRINNEGDYEFRLFSDDSFDLEAESDEFEVED
jgi:hypothetical protein